MTVADDRNGGEGNFQIHFGIFVEIPSTII